MHSLDEFVEIPQLQRLDGFTPAGEGHLLHTVGMIPSDAQKKVVFISATGSSNACFFEP